MGDIILMLVPLSSQWSTLIKETLLQTRGRFFYAEIRWAEILRETLCCG